MLLPSAAARYSTLRPAALVVASRGSWLPSRRAPTPGTTRSRPRRRSSGRPAPRRGCVRSRCRSSAPPLPCDDAPGASPGRGTRRGARPTAPRSRAAASARARRTGSPTRSRDATTSDATGRAEQLPAHVGGADGCEEDHGCRPRCRRRASSARARARTRRSRSGATTRNSASADDRGDGSSNACEPERVGDDRHDEQCERRPTTRRRSPPTGHDVESTGRARPDGRELAPARPAPAGVDETVVRELVDARRRARPRPCAAAARRRRRAARSLPALRRRRAGSTTKPVSPSTTASCEPPLRPATAGTPHAAASRNTIPKPSASSPAQRSRQHIANTSARRVERGQVGVGDPPEEAHVRRAARAARAGARSRPAPAIASCTSGRPRDRVDHDVEALAGHEPRHARARAAGRDRARSARRVSARVVGRRAARKRSPSTPGGMTTPAQRPARDASSACTRGIRRRRRRPRPRRGAPDARAARVPGMRAGTVISAPCATTTYGARGQARADQPERQHRIEEDHVGADLARERVDVAGSARASAATPSARDRSTRNACRASHSAAPA